MAQITERRKGSRLDFKGSFTHYGHAIGALGKWGATHGQSMAMSWALASP